MKRTMMQLALGALVLSTAGETHAGASFQGSSFQGASFQGSSFQGSSFQGASFQGASFQGASFQGASFQGASFQGSSFQGPSITASQLSGLVNGVTLTGSALIGTIFSAQVSGVGTVPARIVDAYSETSTPTMVYSNSMANSPENSNSDVWLYKVQLQVTKQWCNPINRICGDILVWVNLCGQSGSADPTDTYGMFFKENINYEGKPNTNWSNSGIKFSCTSGTLAKAARGFGYKPWATFTSRNPAYPGTASGRDLWLTMLNAAQANYCGNGNSYTVTGTYVDVEDYLKLNVKTPDTDPAAFALESTWTQRTTTLPELALVGGQVQQIGWLNAQFAWMTNLYNPRLLSASSDPTWCTPSVNNFNTVDSTGFNVVNSNQTPNSNYSQIVVHTSKLCPHSANKVGAKLDILCNNLVKSVCTANPKCCSSSWTQTCVDLATATTTNTALLNSGSWNAAHP